MGHPQKEAGACGEAGKGSRSDLLAPGCCPARAFLGIDLSPWYVAFCPRFLQAVSGSLADDVAFKLGEDSKNAEQHLAYCAGEVEVVFDAHELHVLGEELAHGFMEMLHGAAEAIEENGSASVQPVNTNSASAPAKRRSFPEGKPQSRTRSPASAAAEGKQHGKRLTKPLLLKYRSGIKSAILLALTKNPRATDAEVCRLLDADGGEELPIGWRKRREDRSFFDAYTEPTTKRKIEIAISKIRRDLRDRGLLN